MSNYQDELSDLYAAYESNLRPLLEDYANSCADLESKHAANKEQLTSAYKNDRHAMEQGYKDHKDSLGEKTLTRQNRLKAEYLADRAVLVASHSGLEARR